MNSRLFGVSALTLALLCGLTGAWAETPSDLMTAPNSSSVASSAGTDSGANSPSAPATTPADLVPSFLRGQNTTKANDYELDWEIGFMLREGIANHRQGQLGSAISIYERCLQQDARRIEVLPYLALALDQQGESEAALERYAQYLAQQTDDDLVRFNSAVASVHAGRYEQALTWGEPLLERHQLAPLYSLLGLAHLHLNHGDRAVQYLQRAVELRPQSCRMHSDLGAAYLQLGKLREAKDCFIKALRLNPHDGVALNNSGVALEASGRRDLAVLAFREAAKSGVAQAEVNNLALGAAQGQINTMEAAACADKFPESTQARLLYVWMIMSEGRHDEASAELERWQEHHKDSCESYPYLGAIYYQNAQYELALEQYQKWIREAESADAHHNASLCLTKLGRPAEAEVEARRAWEMYPERPEFLYNLGRCCEATGQRAQARRYYEQLAQSYPNFIDSALLKAYCQKLPDT